MGNFDEQLKFFENFTKISEDLREELAPFHGHVFPLRYHNLLRFLLELYENEQDFSETFLTFLGEPWLTFLKKSGLFKPRGCRKIVPTSTFWALKRRANS